MEGNNNTIRRAAMSKLFRNNMNCIAGGLMHRTLVLVLIMPFLGACSDSGETDPPPPPASSTTTTTTTTVATERQSGLAVDGPVSGATVVILEADGDQLTTSTTDAAGRFSVELPTNALYPLTVRVTGGTDIVTNTAATIALAGIVQAADSPMMLTPFSTLAVRHAECTARRSGGNLVAERNARNAITNASVNALLDSLTSFGLNTTVREQLLSRIPTNASQAASMLLSSEQFAEALRRTSLALASTPDARTPDQVLTSLACDLGNGSVDGSESGTTTTRLAALFQLSAAEVGLEAAAGRLRVGGVVANTALNAALLATFGVNTVNVATLTISQETLDQLKKVVNAALVAQASPSLTQLSSSLAGLVAPVSPGSMATVLDALSNTTPLRPVIDAPVTPSATLLAEIQLPGSSTVPVISLFTATPSSFGTSSGGLTTLQWTASGAASCTRGGSDLGWNGGTATSGTIANIGPVILNSTFTLTCTGPGGSVSTSVDVNVVPSAVISFVPEIAAFAEMVTLNISTVNADSCNATLSGGGSPVAILSGGTFSADVGQSVAVSCNGPGGVGAANKSLPVRAARLTWDAPTLTEEVGGTVSLEGFILYHGTTPGSRTEIIAISNSAARELTNGFPSGPRYFQITAIANGNLESRYSEEAFKEIP
jgi:hypothetical protein